MRQFREAGCNTLVSTCVGEEGLDIGDVDLIICFDAHKSPIRLVQRMGRTGRKREGKIVMLVTEGKEEQVKHGSHTIDLKSKLVAHFKIKLCHEIAHTTQGGRDQRTGIIFILCFSSFGSVIFTFLPRFIHIRF